LRFLLKTDGGYPKDAGATTQQLTFKKGGVEGKCQSIIGSRSGASRRKRCVGVWDGMRDPLPCMMERDPLIYGLIDKE